MIDASSIAKIIQPACVMLGVGLFMKLLVRQAATNSPNNQDKSVIILKHPSVIRWLGIICTAFFSFCFIGAFQAHLERPDQRWVFLWFIPFILVSTYLYYESFATITLQHEKISSRSRIFGYKEFSWNDIQKYTFNSILQYHYFIFSDGRKLGFSPYMTGTSSLLEAFAAKYEALLLKQLKESSSNILTGNLLCLLGMTGHIEHQTIFAERFRKGNAAIKESATQAFLMSVYKLKAYNPEAMSAFPLEMRKMIDKGLSEDNQ